MNDKTYIRRILPQQSLFYNEFFVFYKLGDLGNKKRERLPSLPLLACLKIASLRVGAGFKPALTAHIAIQSEISAATIASIWVIGAVLGGN